jgi:hypothetical protein
VGCLRLYRAPARHMTGLETELKDFRTEVFYRFDILGAKFESSQKEMGHTVESSLKEMANSRTSYPQSRMNNKSSFPPSTLVASSV